MVAENVRRLWGHEFRLVPNGLAETDVVEYVDSLRVLYQPAMEDRRHIAVMHELANRTVVEAEQLAEQIKEEGIKESEQRSADIVENAKFKARDIVAEAERAARAVEAESRRMVNRKTSEIEATLRTARKWAVEEFQALQGLHERMQLFFSAFETFLTTLVTAESGENRSPPKTVSLQKEAASDDYTGNTKYSDEVRSELKATAHRNPTSYRDPVEGLEDLLRSLKGGLPPENLD